MEELRLALTGAQLGQKSPGPWVQSLRVGQVLTMTVVDKPASGTLLLQVGGLQVAAKADIPAQIGTVLTLEVSKLGPTPSLKIVNPPAQGFAELAPLDRFLKLLVPAQGSVVAPLQTLLDATKNANILSLLGLSKAEMERIYKTLSKNELPVQASALKNMVQKSGFFLESDLRLLLEAGGLLQSSDLKSVLLSLLARVKWVMAKPPREKGVNPIPDDLLYLKDELEAALATLTLKQLSSWQARERGTLQWSFEIPVRLQNELHTVELKIEREDKGSPEDAESEDWKVLLNVNLPQLGPIAAELFMRGSKVSVVIYAEQGDTAELVDGSMPRLKSALESRGLSVSVVLCHEGSLGDRGESNQWSKYVDEKA